MKAVEDAELGGVVISLGELVDYQDGSIVSRTLLKEDTGTFTVFTFDEGQDLSEHTVPHNALVQVLDGEAEIIIAGTSHRVCVGEAIIMPANQPHAVKARRRFKMALTMIRRPG